MVWNNRSVNNLVNNSNVNSILDFLLTNPVYLNMPYMLAQNKAVPLTCGDAILFDSEDENLLRDLNKWSNNVNLREKIRQMVLQMSLLGKSIAFLERKQKSKDYKNGLLMFKLANEVLMSSVAKVDDIDQIAVIYTNSNKSDSASLQRIEFRPGKMIIQDFSNPDDIRAQHLDAKVISELKPISKAQVFKTDLNFMPFQEFPNKVMPNLNGTNNQTTYSSIPDWWIGRKLIFDIEDNLEKRRSERGKNQTRVFGQFDPEALQNLMLGNSDAEDFIGDLFFQANVQNYMTGTNTLATIQGDPKLEVYHVDKEQTIKTFYESAGYNYFEKDGNYENQTKSVMNYDLDESTTKMKQADILYRLYKIVDLVLEDMGHIVEKDGIRTYSIEFKSTSIVNDIRELDIIDRRLANGTMEPIKAIQLLDKVPRKQAEEYLKNIDKRQDQMIEKDIETQNKLNKWDDSGGVENEE